MQNTMKVTVTYYCQGCDSGHGIGSIDNVLRAGDVAMRDLGPEKIGAGKGKFTFIEFQGRKYRVADKCAASNRLDIYVPNSPQCKCSQVSKFPRIEDQQKQGGYTITILGRSVDSYETK